MYYKNQRWLVEPCKAGVRTLCTKCGTGSRLMYMVLPSAATSGRHVATHLCTLYILNLWDMFFLTLLLLESFSPILSDESETAIADDSTTVPHHGNSTALELECTTSSPSRNFSGCHSEEITKYKAVFIANAAGVISIGAPANLITLLALPYVRLRCHSCK